MNINIYSTEQRMSVIVRFVVTVCEMCHQTLLWHVSPCILCLWRLSLYIPCLWRELPYVLCGMCRCSYYVCGVSSYILCLWRVIVILCLWRVASHILCLWCVAHILCLWHVSWYILCVMVCVVVHTMLVVYCSTYTISSVPVVNNAVLAVHGIFSF